VVGIAAEPTRCCLGLGDEFGGGRPVTVDGGGVGGDREQRAVDRQVVRADGACGLDVSGGGGQQVAGPGAVADPAQRGGNRPPCVGEG
jgi:hypothetical protein